MVSVVIEDNIPLPKRALKPVKWPFGNLRPGQSFLMTEVSLRSAVSSCSKAARRYGGRFVAALANENSNVIRVWRAE